MHTNTFGSSTTASNEKNQYCCQYCRNINTTFNMPKLQQTNPPMEQTSDQRIPGLFSMTSAASSSLDSRDVNGRQPFGNREPNITSYPQQNLNNRSESIAQDLPYSLATQASQNPMKVRTLLAEKFAENLNELTQLLQRQAAGTSLPPSVDTVIPKVSQEPVKMYDEALLNGLHQQQLDTQPQMENQYHHQTSNFNLNDSRVNIPVETEDCDESMDSDDSDESIDSDELSDRYEAESEEDSSSSYQYNVPLREGDNFRLR